MRLKELSDERASRWPNTLSAGRARKERGRQEKLAAEEAERMEADRAEAELRADQRRVQIERANKILFEETDRVKGFHSTLLKSDTMQENEQLIGYKRQIDVLKKAQEAAFVEQQRQALEMAEAAELRKMQQTRVRALDQKAAQTQQLDELKTRILAERADGKREGALLKQRAIEEAEEQKQKELNRMAKAKKLNEETTSANLTLQGFRIKEKERQRDTELAIEAYATKKAALIAERERREAEKRAQKEADRKRIADKLETDFSRQMDLENSRLNRDVMQAEQRSAADEAARQRHMRDTIADIGTSNQRQLRQKAEAKAREKQDEAEARAEWGVRVKELKQEEEAEARARLEKNKDVAGFQQRQALIRSRRKAEAKIAELQDAAQIQLSLREQEEIFQQYAAEWINEYQAQDKSVVPLMIHLNKKTTVETMR